MSSSDKHYCEVSHFFTYWLGGKIIIDSPKDLRESTTHFKYVSFRTTPIWGEVDPNFVEAALIGQWYFTLPEEKNCPPKSPPWQKISYIIENLYLPLSKENRKIEVSVDKFQSKANFPPFRSILVRLFGVGILSISIRWEVECKCSQNNFDEEALDWVADIIKRPEHTTENNIDEKKMDKYVNEIRGKEGCITLSRQPSGLSGELNGFAGKCAIEVAKLFSEAFGELVQKRASRSELAWFGKEDQSNTVLSRKLLSHKWILQPTNPYVGLVIEDLPVQVKELEYLRNLDERSRKKKLANKFCSQLIALSSTSPADFKGKFVNPVSYILEGNIARGNAIAIIDKRCIVTAGLSAKEDATLPLVATLAFSLECVFAAAESVKMFITALENRIPKKNFDLNAALAETFFQKKPPEGSPSLLSGLSGLLANLKKIFFQKEPPDELKQLLMKEEVFRKVISTARAISPCEEKITQVESYVHSVTVFNAANKIKALQLDNLIELARNKMVTYSRLLETGYNFLSTTYDAEMSKKIVNLTLLLAVFTIFTLTCAFVQLAITLHGCIKDP